MYSLYFAYGSNLSVDQMIARVGTLDQGENCPSMAYLANYRLVFQHLASNGHAFANILSPGDGVFGVVYHCSDAALERLDGYEQGYDRAPIEVIGPNGEILAATTYIVKPASTISLGAPSAAYLNKIVAGARQHGLPAEYIDNLLIIAAAANLPTMPRPKHSR